MLDCTHAGSSPHLGILDSCFFVGGSASCGASEQASSGTAIIETQHYSNHGFVSGSVQNNMIQAALSAFGTQQNAGVGHIDKAKLKRKSACTVGRVGVHMVCSSDQRRRGRRPPQRCNSSAERVSTGRATNARAARRIPGPVGSKRWWWRGCS